MDVYDRNTEADIAVAEMQSQTVLNNQYDREAFIETKAIKEECTSPQAIYDLDSALQEILAGGDPITYH